MRIFKPEDPLALRHVIVDAAAEGRAAPGERAAERGVERSTSGIGASDVTAHGRIGPGPTCRAEEQPVAAHKTKPAADARERANQLGRGEVAVRDDAATGVEQGMRLARKLQRRAAEATLDAEEDVGRHLPVVAELHAGRFAGAAADRACRSNCRAKCIGRVGGSERVIAGKDAAEVSADVEAGPGEDLRRDVFGRLGVAARRQIGGRRSGCEADRGDGGGEKKLGIHVAHAFFGSTRPASR